jgi:hypothetical protein
MIMTTPVTTIPGAITCIVIVMCRVAQPERPSSV